MESDQILKGHDVKKDMYYNQSNKQREIPNMRCVSNISSVGVGV